MSEDQTKNLSNTYLPNWVIQQHVEVFFVHHLLVTMIAWWFLLLNNVLHHNLSAKSHEIARNFVLIAHNFGSSDKGVERSLCVQFLRRCPRFGGTSWASNSVTSSRTAKNFIELNFIRLIVWKII